MIVESLPGDNIQVVVRVRPFNEREKKNLERKCIEVSQAFPNSVIVDAKPEQKRFNFDWVAGEECTQTELYKRTGEPVASSCLEGYNCTIFAYGQTGSGKTYTMQGGRLDCFENELEDSKGLQPRVLEHIFNRLKAEASEAGLEYLVKCSYFEIYNEQIIDLLNPSAGALQVREDMKRGAFVDGITEDVVRNCSEAIQLLVRGARNRHVGSTEMNRESSRSHSVLSLMIEQKRIKEGVVNVVSSKINFVDLAGSERQKSTNSSGERLKEAGNINKSLTVLGSVINSLVEISEGKKHHVRYRDSRLTFLLKDSLGGNSKTMIVANVSAASDSFGETLSTLKFAQRAKLIRNKASINEETSGCIDSLKQEIERLKAALSAERDQHKREVDNQGSAMKSKQLTVDQEIELVRDCNESRYQLELMLKESMDILNSTDKKLQYEYMKKDEFIKLFEKGCSMYEKKEKHMAFMLRIMQDKCDRVAKGDWSRDNELDTLSQTVKILNESAETVPAVMDVFEENLRLKHQIIYSNVDGQPSANIKKVLSILHQNMSYMQDLSVQMADSLAERQKLRDRFDKLCMSKGMTADDINRVDADIENDGLKQDLHKANLEIIERKKLEQDAYAKFDAQDRLFCELKAELDKEKADHQADIDGLEDRIRELNSSYLAMQQQGTAASNDYQVREIQLRDMIGALTLKKSELLKKLDRAEVKLAAEKEEQAQIVSNYEKKLSQLTLNNLRLEEDIGVRKQTNEKLKSESAMMKKQLESMVGKLKGDSDEKDRLNKAIHELEKTLELTQEAAKGRYEALEKSFQEISDKIEVLEAEKDQLEADRRQAKEELDTANEVLDYTKSQLEQKNKEVQDRIEDIEKLTQEMKTLTENESSLTSNLRNLEVELEKQTKSNSPFNVAIKENHSLRTMLREKALEMTQLEKQKKQDRQSIEQLQKTLQNVYKSESYYKAATRDLTEDNQRKDLQLKELTDLLGQNDKEINDQNSTIKVLQDDVARMQEYVATGKESFKAKLSELNDAYTRLTYSDKRCAELKGILDKRNEELSLSHGKVSESQLRYFTLREEFDMYKQRAEREIGHLQSSLKCINEQNIVLIQEKNDKEEEFKKSKATLLTEISKMSSENKEFKVLLTNLQDCKSMDKTKLESLKNDLANNVKSEREETEKAKTELIQARSALTVKKNQYASLLVKHENMIKSFYEQLQIVRSDKQRLDSQNKIMHDIFKMKEQELGKTVEEMRLLSLDKQALEEELNHSRLDMSITSSKLSAMMSKVDLLNKQMAGLRSDNDLLTRMVEDPSARNRLKDERVTILKAEIDSLKKDATPAKSAQKKGGKGARLCEEDLDSEERLTELYVNEEVRDIVRSLSLKMAQFDHEAERKVTSKNDVVELLSTFERRIDSFTERDRLVQQKTLENEKKFIRYGLLEREIEFLKQKHTSETSAKTLMQENQGSFVNKRPRYVTKEKCKDTASMVSNLKQAIISFPIRADSFLQENTPLTTKSKKKSNIENASLGKRVLNFDDENVLQESGNRKLNNPAYMAPSASKQLAKSTSKPVQTIMNEYVGMVTNSDIDLENYDNQASTPRKKIKSD